MRRRRRRKKSIENRGVREVWKLLHTVTIENPGRRDGWG
jgi:hypothetical protein